jgi:hydrogenase maturation protease
MLHVIGIGSPFGADDVGWRIVKSLRNSSRLSAFSSQLTFEQSDRPGASLLAMLEDKEDVVLIDAMVSGATPGTVKLFHPDEIAEATGLTSSHGFGVRDALMLGKILGLLPARLQVVGVEIAPSAMISGAAFKEAVAVVEVTLTARLSPQNCEQRLKTIS